MDVGAVCTNTCWKACPFVTPQHTQYSFFTFLSNHQCYLSVCLQSRRVEQETLLSPGLKESLKTEKKLFFSHSFFLNLASSLTTLSWRPVTLQWCVLSHTIRLGVVILISCGYSVQLLQPRKSYLSQIMKTDIHCSIILIIYDKHIITLVLGTCIKTHVTI